MPPDPWSFSFSLPVQDIDQNQKFKDVMDTVKQVVFGGAAYERLVGDTTFLGARPGGFFVRITRTALCLIVEGILPTPFEIVKLASKLNVKADDLKLERS